MPGDLVPHASQEIVVRPFGWEPKGRLAELAARPNPDESLSVEAAKLVFKGMSPNTVATYAYQWWKFVRWCGDTGRAHEPGLVTKETVIEWMNELWRRRGRYGRPSAPETVALSLKVVAVAHKRAKRTEVGPGGQALYGYVSPTTHPDVHAAMRGYRTQWTEAGHRPDTAYPLTPDELELMIETLDTRTPMGVCDATLLAIGYDLGGRRVELAKLNIGDIEVHVGDPDEITEDDFLIVNIPMSKTDRSGEGADIPLYAHPPEDAATCPVRWAVRWLDLLAEQDIRTGPFFRVVRTGGKLRRDGAPKTGIITGERIDGVRVEVVVRRSASIAGLTAGGGRRKHIVPHSLRAGSATTAAEYGADTAALNHHFRWSDRGTTANRYVRAGRRRSMNPVRGIYAGRRRRRTSPNGGDQ